MRFIPQMLNENKKVFSAGRMEKYRYMRRMFETHKILYEYADFISKSNISDITIKAGKVYFTFLNEGIPIRMVSIPYDMTSVPFTFMDFGSYEQEETKFLLGLVKDNDVVLDIGANSGWYTINWLKKRKNVKVFSFEPTPALYDNLVHNLLLNGQKTKNAFNYGLSNANGIKNFFFDLERCGASSMVNLRGTENTKNIKCRVKRLDDVFPSLGVSRLDLIKCDTEGAEKLVLKGGMDTIKRYKPVIFCEMLRKWARKFNYHPNDIIAMLAGVGYTCHVIHNNKLRRIGGVTDKTTETNFVFLNKNRKRL